MNYSEVVQVVLTVVLPALFGGGVVGAIMNAISEMRRVERVDRVAELAEAQQEALKNATRNENLLRALLFDQKEEMRKLDQAWRDRVLAMEERYEQKCEEIEAMARERAQEYEAEIAMLRMEIDRLRVLILRNGIDPSLVCKMPSEP